MTTYYLATSRGDDMSQWVYMFETPTQANKFVRDVAERKLPDHPAYVGLQWDIMPITLQLPKQALGDFLMLDDLPKEKPSMTDKQLLAIRCAFADLCGSLQAFEQGDMHVHDWKAHKLSIQELAQAFGLEDEIPEEQS